MEIETRSLNAKPQRAAEVAAQSLGGRKFGDQVDLPAIKLQLACVEGCLERAIGGELPIDQPGGGKDQHCNRGQRHSRVPLQARGASLSRRNVRERLLLARERLLRAPERFLGAPERFLLFLTFGRFARLAGDEVLARGRHLT